MRATAKPLEEGMMNEPMNPETADNTHYAQIYTLNVELYTKNKNFSLPDCTVGFGIAPNLPKRLAGFNRRWRISLRPEIF